MESPKTAYSASVAEATRNPNFCSRRLLPGTVVGLSQCCLISTAFPKAKPTAYHLLRPLAVGGRLSSKTTVHSNSPQRILVGGWLAVSIIPLRTTPTVADWCPLSSLFCQCMKDCQCCPLKISITFFGPPLVHCPHSLSVLVPVEPLWSPITVSGAVPVSLTSS